jgi:hypothetical protein
MPLRLRTYIFVAHHDTFAELETEYITRVDPGVDAAEHPQDAAGREGKADERPRRGERRVAPNQVAGRDAHVCGAYPSPCVTSSQG